MMTVMINSVRKNQRFWTRKVRTRLVRKFGESALSPDESDGAVLRKTIKDAQLEPILIRRYGARHSHLHTARAPPY
jgi:hypothetical protein